MLKLVTIIEENKGYTPMREGDNTFYMHWSNGSPGMIPMLTIAAKRFPKLRERLLNAAEMAGEVTWRKGLVLRGNSLSFGISGNGYMLHTLYRTYKDFSQTDYNSLKREKYKTLARKWRQRTYVFAWALTDPGV